MTLMGDIPQLPASTAANSCTERYDQCLRFVGTKAKLIEDSPCFISMQGWGKVGGR